MEVVHPQVAGIDVHKKVIWVAVRLPGEGPGQRALTVRRFKTFWRALQKMAGWLAELGVTDAAMESTGVYWWPVYHALAGAGIEVCVCNAAHMRNVPGRKTDLADCQWIAELHEYGLLRASFIPDAQVAALRQRTRYRKKLIEQRSSEGQRLAKVLEDAGIKIDSVASDMLGKSGRAMIEALIAGERDPARLAGLALAPCTEIRDLDTKLASLLHQADPAAIMTSVAGVGIINGAQILARLGDPARFQSLAGARSFSGLVPSLSASGINGRHGPPTKSGDAPLREALFMAANAARRTDPSLAARYHRLMVTRGKHHNSALCHISTALLTRIIACWRASTPYQIRDTDGTPLTTAQGRAIIAQRYRVSGELRAQRRTSHTTTGTSRRHQEPPGAPTPVRPQTTLRPPAQPLAAPASRSATLPRQSGGRLVSIQGRVRGMDESELNRLPGQDSLGDPVRSGPSPVARQRQQVVAPRHRLRREPGQRDLQRIRGRLPATQIDDEAEVVVFVRPPGAVPKRRGDVAGGAFALPLGVLRRHRGDLAGSGQVRHCRDVAACPDIWLARDREVLIHDEPALPDVEAHALHERFRSHSHAPDQ